MSNTTLLVLAVIFGLFLLGTAIGVHRDCVELSAPYTHDWYVRGCDHR